MNQPKRKRRFFSYSLRGLFIVVTILCVALGYWSHRANRQQAVVKWVKENGGAVYYDYELDEEGRLISYQGGPDTWPIHGSFARRELSDQRTRCCRVFAPNNLLKADVWPISSTA